MDLGPQRPQLRLPRRDLELEGAPLGLLRRLEGPQEVVERRGEEIEHHPEPEQERGGLGLLRREPGERPVAIEEEGPPAARDEPDDGRDDGGHELGPEGPEKARELEGGRAADPEGAEADEAEEDREGQGEHRRLEPPEGHGGDEERREQTPEERPGGQIGPEDAASRRRIGCMG